MPNLKYSGSKGIVQSTGSGAFQLSGVGVSHDVATISHLQANGTTTPYGVTIINNVTGNRVLTIPNPKDSTNKSQQKLVVLKGRDGNGDVQIASETTGNVNNGKLDAVDDYCLLVWNNSDWVTIATNSN